MIYLAGPMSGLRAHHAVGWRGVVTDSLSDTCRCLSPMRGVVSDIVPMSDESNPLTTKAAVLARDRFDIERADLVFANLLGAKTVSIGTVFELGQADIYRIPVLLVMENEGNVHDHPMVTHTAAFRADNLPDAIQIVRDVL